jgi:hypothetical protein
MNMEQKNAHYNYCRHVRKERAWIAGRHSAYKHMDCWEALCIQAHGLLGGTLHTSTEQQVSDTNPLFELAKITNTPRL